MTGCAAISSLKQNKNTCTLESPTIKSTDTLPFLNSCQILKGGKKKMLYIVLWIRQLLIRENTVNREKFLNTNFLIYGTSVYSVVICALFTIWNVLTRVSTSVIKIIPHMTDIANVHVVFYSCAVGLF